MATFPYILQLQIAVLASAAGTATFPLPPNETHSYHQIRVSSTGTFKVTDMRDSSGNHYSNTSLSTGLPSTLFQNVGSANIGLQVFDEPIKLTGGWVFYVDVLDTSALANTINVFFIGSKTTSGN